MKKHVLITGASSGIGEATARYLSSLGYRLVLVARNEKRLKQLCDELGQETACFSCDLEKTEEIGTIFAFCKDLGIRLDGLVHSAGDCVHLPVRAMDAGILDRIMKVNAYSFLELGRFFYKKEYANDGAGMVGISSYSAVTMRPGTAIYSGSKELLNVYTVIMAKEFVKRRIRVNAIMPAFVRTPMTANRTGLDEEMPLGVIDPAEVSYLTEFLLSEKAAHITGASIPVSGGMER